MQKLWDLDRWKELRAGTSLVFTDSRPRMVRLDFNSPHAVQVYIKTGKDVRFLCRTEGRDIVEFAINASFSLLLEEGVTFIHADEGDLTHFDQTDEETFARIHEPRQRNYEQEFMAYKVKETFNRRMSEMNAMFDQRMKEQSNVTSEQANSDDGQTEQKPTELATTETEDE